MINAYHHMYFRGELANVLKRLKLLAAEDHTSILTKESKNQYLESFDKDNFGNDISSTVLFSDVIDCLEGDAQKDLDGSVTPKSTGCLNCNRDCGRTLPQSSRNIPQSVSTDDLHSNMGSNDDVLVSQNNSVGGLIDCVTNKTTSETDRGVIDKLAGSGGKGKNIKSVEFGQNSNLLVPNKSINRMKNDVESSVSTVTKIDIDANRKLFVNEENSNMMVSEKADKVMVR